MQAITPPPVPVNPLPPHRVHLMNPMSRANIDRRVVFDQMNELNPYQLTETLLSPPASRIDIYSDINSQITPTSFMNEYQNNNRNRLYNPPQ